MSPKPAYLELKKLIREQWMTRCEGKTDKKGEFTFRGFCGEYIARIKRNGKVVEEPFHIGPQERNVINIILREKWIDNQR
jgi:hypothetical protein